MARILTDHPGDTLAGTQVAITLALSLGLSEVAWELAHRAGLTTYDDGCRCRACLKRGPRVDNPLPARRPPRQPWEV